MAYVKTIWVDDETVVTAENMNHIEDGIKNLESVSLLAVSDTAPSECVEGDLYYNTTTKKIYQAIDTDTWDSEGTDPLDKILYIVFSTKTTYSLDENGDLISVGGGGAEIAVSTTEPTEDEVLWIKSNETTNQARYRDGNNNWKELSIKALDGMVIGSIIQFVGTTIPVGWLECDGSTITQSAYPELYALIGGTLPDFRGKVLVGQDTNDTDFDTIGETGGEKTHKHTGGNHTHGLSSGYACIGTGWDGSNILRQQTKLTISAGTRGMPNMPGYNNTSTSSYDASALGGTTDGSGQVDTTSSSSLQPYGVVKHIIKATNTTPTMASVVNAYNTSTEDSYSCKYINDLVDYSTTEIKTGKKWIDGKPIYRKVFYNEGTLTYTNNKATIPSNISNMSALTKIEGIVNDSVGGYYTLPYINIGQLSYGIGLEYDNSGNIVVKQSAYDTRLTKYVFVLEYTKTTD